MDFKHEKGLCSFSIPDRPTVRQQMRWFAAASGSEETESIERYWMGAQQLIQTWTCESLPDYKVSLDEISEPTQTSIMIWAGLEVLKFMNALEDVPKN